MFLRMFSSRLMVNVSSFAFSRLIRARNMRFVFHLSRRKNLWPRCLAMAAAGAASSCCLVGQARR
jgi:hypothetical protein